MADARPNILILMPDQMRADCMGCADHPQIRTPHMDRLAAEGVRFSHACTSSPLCMPARASFISGLHVHNHNMWANAGELAADDDSLFQHLQRAGYHTGHIGKSHYYEQGRIHMRDREPYMHARGFDTVHETTGPWATRGCRSYMTDDWERKGLLQPFLDDYQKRWEERQKPSVPVWPSPLPVEDFMDSYIGRQAVRFVDDYNRDEPFALFVGFGGPHEPWDAPGEYATMYDPAETPPWIGADEPGDWVASLAAEWQRHARPATMTADDIRRLRANYYGKISLIDHWFGQIMAACERKGVADDLLVVFWSDHGEMAGDHQLLYKSRFYESALRVPLIIRWPGHIGAGHSTPALAQTVDLMPTILEAIGCEAPSRCMGRSLWPALGDPSASVHDAVFSEVNSGGHRISMVRTARHKYAVFESGEGYMLHDLKADPDERVNLVGHSDHRAIEAELRDRLLRFLCDTQYVMRMD